MGVPGDLRFCVLSLTAHAIVCGKFRDDFTDTMKRLIKWLFIVAFLLGLLLGILAVSSLDEHPLVSAPQALQSQQLARVKQLIQQNNPQRLRSGELAQTTLSQQDLNLSLNYLTQKLPVPVMRDLASQLKLFNNSAWFQLSLPLTWPVADRYLNLSGSFDVIESANGQHYALSGLRLGGINLPDALLQPVSVHLHQQLLHHLPEYALLRQSIQRIEIEPQQLRLQYVLNRQVSEQLKTQLSSRVVSAEFKQALLAQSQMLQDQLSVSSARLKLEAVLQPMFALAGERSQHGDAITENRALFVALAAYMLNRDIGGLLGESRPSPIRAKKIYLQGRHDLSKHLVISAAITSLADSKLAALIGLDKEVDDSVDGSGFSFADLAADYAGIRLAEAATASRADAIRVQQRLGQKHSAALYMPPIQSLPQAMTDSEFAQRYQHTESEHYRQLLAQINLDIEQLALYRGE